MNVLFGEHGLSKQVGRPPRYAALLSDFLNNPDKTFLTLTGARVEALPDPEMKFEAPFLALNKSVVTMIRAIKE